MEEDSINKQKTKYVMSDDVKYRVEIRKVGDEKCWGRGVGGGRFAILYR